MPEKVSHGLAIDTHRDIRFVVSPAHRVRPMEQSLRAPVNVAKHELARTGDAGQPFARTGFGGNEPPEDNHW